jgi:PAS domain S-box-containing protein
MGNKAVVLSNDFMIEDGEQILEAIRTGCVDAFVVEEQEGRTVYTLHNTDLPYSTLVQRMEQGAAMLNAAGELIYCNASLASLLGRSPESLIGTPLPDLVVPEDRAALQAMVQTSPESLTGGEARLRKPDGGFLWARFSANSLSRDGSVTGILVTDLTTEKAHAELVARIQGLQDEERRNIARELHDSVGQLLVALTMNLSAIRKSVGGLEPEGSKLLADSSVIVGALTKEIRTISHLLHPPLLGVAGLCSAIRWYVDGFSERSHIVVDLDIPSDVAPVSDEVGIALFRVVQECLTNVYRHSGSKSCSIKLQREENSLRLEVRDAGKGMPKAAASSSSGVGLRGIRERLRYLGGKLELESSESGTAVIALVPMMQPAVAEEQQPNP